MVKMLTHKKESSIKNAAMVDVQQIAMMLNVFRVASAPLP
jgi:hypothetical protein